MGRYYNGDINGKFWFAVQSSTCGEQFGATEIEPNEIRYCIEDSEIACKRLIEIQNELGNKKLNIFIDFFFINNNGYNDEELAKYFKTRDSEYKRKDLKLYADYEFGVEVVEYFKKHEGPIYYDAEI